MFSRRKVYSGFWRRFLAFLLDSILITAVLVGVAVAVAATSSPTDIERQGILSFIYVVGGWLYYALLESSVAQATPGKLALGLRVTDLAGNRISFIRATGRYFGKTLSGLILGIGYLMVVFTHKRQGLHDMLAGTLVVRRPFSPEEVASAGPARHVPAAVAVLVILAGILVGPPGLGFVSAVALPAYHSYTISSQIAEGLSLAEPYKSAVRDALANEHAPGLINTDTLNVAAPTVGRYVEKIEVISGIVDIKFGRAAHPEIAGKSLLLAPGRDANGEVTWSCATTLVPTGFLMPYKELQGHISVASQYLPDPCHG